MGMIARTGANLLPTTPPNVAVAVFSVVAVVDAVSLFLSSLERVTLLWIVARICILSLLFPLNLLSHHGGRCCHRRPSSSLLLYFRPLLRRR